jgi:hypothetical protein
MSVSDQSPILDVGAKVPFLAVPLFLLAACFASSDDSVSGSGWSSPDCDRVTGSPLVTFSPDRGQTLVPVEDEPSDGWENIGETRFLYLSQIDGGMASDSADDTMQVSDDAGCSWKLNGEGVDYPATLDIHGSPVANGSHIFGLSRTVSQGGSVSHDIYRLSLSGERDNVFAVDEWPWSLATTESDPESVYLVENRADSSRQFVIWRAEDDGEHWYEEGDVPEQFLPFFDINRYDPLHFVAGGEGRFASSFDGGASWQEGGHFGHEDVDYSTIRSVNFGGTEGSGEIWMAVLDEFDHGGPEERSDAVLYYSNDNGQNFSEIYRTSADRSQLPYFGKSITTRAGTTGELYFTLRECGMYRYRVEDDSLKEYTWDGRANMGVSGILAHPTDSDVIYVANGYQADCE